jgi:hypothetical protein
VEKESDPKTWIAREAVQTPPRNSNERRVENKVVNPEKDALRSNAHHWLILLASVFLVGAQVCWPWRKRAATVAVALPLHITLDITAVPDTVRQLSEWDSSSQVRRCQIYQKVVLPSGPGFVHQILAMTIQQVAKCPSRRADRFSQLFVPRELRDLR